MVQLKPRMKVEPISLQAEGSNTYRVRFSSPEGDLEYVFQVDTEKIPVVKWEDRFRVDMGGTLDPATPLFDAILGFHKARTTMPQ
ncbi:MAG TPA: hypothetical protein V6D08_04305 [Candidatus Obscuribacterales bacterium]